MTGLSLKAVSDVRQWEPRGERACHTAEEENEEEYPDQDHSISGLHRHYSATEKCKNLHVLYAEYLQKVFS